MAKLPVSRLWGLFTDLFHLIQSLEHDYKKEEGQKAHAIGCRRGAVTVRLNGIRVQIFKLLRDIEFAIGETLEKK
jgi:hypothetical protein